MKKTILLVEDDVSVQFTLSTLLHCTGYHVLLASNGEIAVTMLSNHIDAIICDIDMPHMNGLELFSIFRLSPWFKKIPFLLLSGCIDNYHLSDINDIDCFLKKPVRIEVLHIALLALFEMYHM